MKNLIVILGVMWMSACAVAPGDRPAPSEESATEQASALDPATPELDAVADALGLGGATTNAACHGAIACTPLSDYSCDNWSAPRLCGATFCGAPCGPKCPIGETCTRTLRQPTEEFRTCHVPNDPDHTRDCIEWAPSGSTAIGCGGGRCGTLP